VKRTDLLKTLQAVAQSKGLVLELIREGGNHTVYRVGAYQFPIARHREIPERTAQGTINQVEKEA
jgi:hypothetical protein